jgi:arylsulfatase/arylsulfatase A
VLSRRRLFSTALATSAVLLSPLSRAFGQFINRPARIIIGSDMENPIRLSRQDWRGVEAGWTPESVGYWEVKIQRAGRYEVMVRSRGEFNTYEASVDYGSRMTKFGLLPNKTVKQKPTRKDHSQTIELEEGEARIQAVVRFGKSIRGADYVELKYLGPGGKK